MKDAGFTQAGPADADDVATLVLDPTAVEQLSDHAGWELGSQREVVGAQVVVDLGQARAFEVASEATALAGVDLMAKHLENESSVAGALLFGPCEDVRQLVTQGGQVQLMSQRKKLLEIAW